MPAPTGNSNAQKWTLDETIKSLRIIEHFAEQEHIMHLGRALTSARLYMGVWSYWKKRWADNDEIIDQMGFIEQIFINKIMEGAMTRRLHAGVCIFMLKVNYGLTDRWHKDPEPEPLPPPPPSPEEIKQHQEHVLAKVREYNEQHPDRTISESRDYLLEDPADIPTIKVAEGFYIRI